MSGRNKVQKWCKNCFYEVEIVVQELVIDNLVVIFQTIRLCWNWPYLSLV